MVDKLIFHFYYWYLSLSEKITNDKLVDFNAPIDQYKDDMATKMGPFMVSKRNEEMGISPEGELTLENKMKENETSDEGDKKKPYRLNTENFF